MSLEETSAKISVHIRHTSKSKSVTRSLCIHHSWWALLCPTLKQIFTFHHHLPPQEAEGAMRDTAAYCWAPVGWCCTPSDDHFQNYTRKIPLKNKNVLLTQMVNAQNQAVGATLLPASENTRCERNTQIYWRAITGIQAHKACLLLRSEFPTGSNKKQIFVSETPLVFNYSHLYLLLTFFWDETLYLTAYPSSEHSYDRPAEPRIFQEINLSPAFLLFSTLFLKNIYLERNKLIPFFPIHFHLSLPPWS